MVYTSRQLAQALWKEVISTSPNHYDKVIDNFLDFCRKKNLNYLLPRVLELLERYYKEKKKSETFFIKSAQPITQKDLYKIMSRLNVDERAEVLVDIDKSLYAGFVSSYKNVIYDASVKNQLVKLKNNLLYR